MDGEAHQGGEHHQAHPDIADGPVAERALWQKDLRDPQRQGQEHRRKVGHDGADAQSLRQGRMRQPHVQQAGCRQKEDDRAAAYGERFLDR